MAIRLRKLNKMAEQLGSAQNANRGKMRYIEIGATYKVQIPKDYIWSDAELEELQIGDYRLFWFDQYLDRLGNSRGQRCSHTAHEPEGRDYAAANPGICLVDIYRPRQATARQRLEPTVGKNSVSSSNRSRTA